MTLKQRAALRDTVTPIPAGVMIETRSVHYGSLFLRAYTEYNGTTYKLTRGVSGRTALKHFVPLGGKLHYIAGKGWTIS